jgi:hypothetical protein
MPCDLRIQNRYQKQRAEIMVNFLAAHYTLLIWIVSILEWLGGFYLGRWYERKLQRELQPSNPSTLSRTEKAQVVNNAFLEAFENFKISGEPAPVPPAPVSAVKVQRGTVFAISPEINVKLVDGLHVIITTKTRGLELQKLQVGDELECHIKDGVVKYAFLIP